MSQIFSFWVIFKKNGLKIQICPETKNKLNLSNKNELWLWRSELLSAFFQMRIFAILVSPEPKNNIFFVKNSDATYRSVIHHYGIAKNPSSIEFPWWWNNLSPTKYGLNPFIWVSVENFTHEEEYSIENY